jgi:Cytochrome P460
MSFLSNNISSSTNNHLNLFLVISIFITLLSISSCKKDKAGKDIDTELYDMAKETSGFVWYKNVDTLLPISAGSGHSYPFLRTRFNSIAASQLESNGKIKVTADFPEGSVIVKELYSTQTNLSRYAILYKKAENENADTNGWVWGYINADGSIATSASGKGVSCISCHSQAGNIDYMLMNSYFP